MGVNVHETGRDEQAIGFEHAMRRRIDAADGGDHAVFDSNVGGEWRCAGTIDNGSGADQQIVHGRLQFEESQPLMIRRYGLMKNNGPC